jgi:hypothetical protein
MGGTPHWRGGHLAWLQDAAKTGAAERERCAALVEIQWQTPLGLWRVRMERLLWIVAPIAIFAGSALAQQPSAYCEAGSHAVGRFAMTRRNPSALPDESLVYNNCSPGDTIIIAGTYLSLIARVCDFSRSVIATPGGNVLCVVSPQRPIRNE